MKMMRVAFGVLGTGEGATLGLNIAGGGNLMKNIKEDIFPILGRNECRESSLATCTSVSICMFLLVF